MLGFDLVDGNLLVVCLGQRTRHPNALDPAFRILVAVLCRLYVPFVGLFEVDWNMHANLVEITHSELRCRQACCSCTLRILIG
jgi:hypothetical protein